MSTREAPPSPSGDPLRPVRQDPPARRGAASPVGRNGQRSGQRNGRPGRDPRRSGSPRRLAPARPANVRRVRRVVRHVDVWSVFRFSVLLFTSFLLVFMVAGVGLWLAATATGARHSVEHFIASTLLFKNFQFDSLQILGSSALIGVVLVAVATMVSVVIATFYNLISDVVGGIEFTFLEDEPVDPVV